MGDEQSSASSASSSQTSSLGDYSSHKSFGSAFNSAHNRTGSGHTFTCNNKMYTTDCADDDDYRAKPDNKSAWQHKMHQCGHETNAFLKDHSGGKVKLDQ